MAKILVIKDFFVLENKMTRCTALFLPAALAVCALGAPAKAATLGLTTEATPHVNATGDLFNPFGFGFDFVDIFSTGAGTGALSGYTGLDTGLTADILPDGSIGGFGGSFFVDDAFAVPSPVQVVNSAVLVGFGFVYDASGDDTLEFQFGSIAGDESDLFAEGALVTITGELGANLTETFDLATQGIFDVSFKVAPISAPAVIPLPAGGLLLLTGLGGLAAWRRRQTR